MVDRNKSDKMVRLFNSKIKKSIIGGIFIIITFKLLGKRNLDTSLTKILQSATIDSIHQPETLDLQNVESVSKTGKYNKIGEYDNIYLEAANLLKNLPKNVVAREKYFAKSDFLQNSLAKLEQASRFDLVAKALSNSLYNQIFLGELDPASPNFEIQIDQHNKEIIRDHRLPNVMSIGAKKCGTGAVQDFLSHHSKFHLVKSIWDEEHKKHKIIEPHYYDLNFDRGLDWYLPLFPALRTTDILWEKSPRYLATLEAPKRVYETYKNYGNGEQGYEKKLKFIVMTCNPTPRAFSDFTQSYTTLDWTPEEKQYVRSFIGQNVVSFKDFIVDRLTDYRLKPSVAEGYTEMTKLAVKFFDEMKQKFDPHHNNTAEYYDFLAKFNDHKLHYPKKFSYLWQSVAKGIFSYQIKNWLEYFDRDQFIFVNGDDFQKNPGKHIERIQKKLGLRVEITEKENFVYAEKKRNYCFRENSRSQPQCLKGSKGRTKNSEGKSIMPEEAQRILREFFRPYNQEFYDIVGEDYNW